MSATTRQGSELQTDSYTTFLVKIGS